MDENIYNKDFQLATIEFKLGADNLYPTKVLDSNNVIAKKNLKNAKNSP